MSADRIEVDGHDLAISNPDKVFFAKRGITKGQLVEYYLAVAGGALTGCFDRPSVLKRYPNGAAGPFFFQKRAPVGDAPYLRTTTVHFPSGRSAGLLVIELGGGPALVGQPRLHRHQPVAGAERRHRPP